MRFGDFPLVALMVALTSQLAWQHGFEIDPEKDPENTLHRSDFIRDKDHLRGHLKDIDFDPDKITPEELDFHFFKVHDANGDNNLDGLELLQAIRHAIDHQMDKSNENTGNNDNSGQFRKSMYAQLEAIVDKILADDDADGDGYINYSEYAKTRRASELLQQIATSKDNA